MNNAYAPFEDLRQRYYPGSRKIRGSVPQAAREYEDIDRWDDRPFMKVLNGQEVEMFTISALAKAIGKSVQSVRLYETHGYLPKTPYRNPSTVVNGVSRLGRRLYTRAMVEEVVTALDGRGLLNAPRIEWGEHPDLPREIADAWKLLREPHITTDRKDH